MFRAGLVFILLFFLQTIYAKDIQVHLGNETVVIRQLRQGPGKTFVHLHQNETTALEAAKAIIMANGGSLLTLIHSGQRNIVFYLNKTRFEFDPNRIFSDVGIKKTLSRFGQYSPQAHQEVKKLANQIKMLLPKGKVIAVHNNRSYSFKDYLPGHGLATEAGALTFPDKKHYRNFFLVTQKTDYLRLNELKFNSIWQAAQPEDDGSLSVYLSQQDYVNVEAGYGELAAQIKMLQHA